MKTLTASQRFWVAVLVVGGYLLFGATVCFMPMQDKGSLFANTVLATMGPLVGWVIKGLFDAPRHAEDAPSGTATDPVHTQEEPQL